MTHGGRGRRGRWKLHRGVDQSGVIRVHTLTEATGDNATIAIDLLAVVEGPLVRVTADAASDTVAVYETAGARGATVVVPPARTANVSGHGPRSPARDRTITLVKTLGRCRWKQASGYHRQGRVENAFFRYKSIIGDSLRARSPAGQGSEVVLGCEILNRMTALGRPVSSRISCNNARRWRGVDGAGGCPAGAPAGQPIPRVAVRKKARWNRGPSGARCSLVRVARALLHPAHAAAGHRGRRVLLLLGDLRDQRFGGQEE